MYQEGEREKEERGLEERIMDRKPMPKKLYTDVIKEKAKG